MLVERDQDREAVRIIADRPRPLLRELYKEGLLRSRLELPVGRSNF